MKLKLGKQMDYSRPVADESTYDLIFLHRKLKKGKEYNHICPSWIETGPVSPSLRPLQGLIGRVDRCDVRFLLHYCASPFRLIYEPTSQ